MTQFKKGQVVTMQHPKSKAMLAAVIAKSTAADLVVEADKGEGHMIRFEAKRNRRTPAQLAEGLKITAGCDLPISPELQKAIDTANGKIPKVTKGQIVSYEMDGEQCTGRVNKGGKTPLVSHKDGSHIKGPAHVFTPCEAPEIDPELADWSVTAFVDQGMGRDFARWQATVAYRGKDEFYAICDGDGGPLRYEPVSRSKTEYMRQRESIATWQKALTDYIKAKGGNNTIVDELWPTYKWDMAPTGVTFADYINDPKL